MSDLKKKYHVLRETKKWHAKFSLCTTEFDILIQRETTEMTAAA
jgi:hypothetical protein